QEEPVLHAVEELDEENREIHVQSLQPLAGSASALTATPTSLFLPASTLRTYMSCTGLWDLDRTKLPRGLSILAFSSALISSARLVTSPPAAPSPASRSWAAS